MRLSDFFRAPCLAYNQPLGHRFCGGLVEWLVVPSGILDFSFAQTTRQLSLPPLPYPVFSSWKTIVRNIAENARRDGILPDSASAWLVAC